MSRKLQVVFDCRDPKGLAEFYVKALDYKLQDPPSGYASWEEALKDWGIPEEDWESASAIIDPEGIGPRIYFQRMDTPKPDKNRLHIDINVSGGSRVPLEKRKEQVLVEVRRLQMLGATKQYELEDREFCVVMQDPEGNEFCVQ